MSTPFYVSPEQVMKDKADYARKGIARGRAVVVVAHTGGILFASENSSRALHKISEIYDRVAFAAVGKYNEFENLRVAGVRYADLRGYSYDRSDVTARGLANAYAQTLGSIFTTESKPYEVEIVVAEAGQDASGDQIYRLTYDGSVADEHGFVAMGGSAEQIGAHLARGWRPDLDADAALALAVAALGADADAEAAGRGPRVIPAEHLEVAVLDRSRERRLFRRLPAAVLARSLGAPPPGGGPGAEASSGPDTPPQPAG